MFCIRYPPFRDTKGDIQESSLIGFNDYIDNLEPIIIVMFTEEQKEAVFQKCRTINGMSPKLWRLDSSGAIIKKTSYGRDDDLYGWEIDHVIPRSILDKYNVPKDLQNDLTNLRAMNWNNNASKGDSYPSYEIVVTSEDDGNSNTFTVGSRTVNHKLQERLQSLFGDYINFDEL